MPRSDVEISMLKPANYIKELYNSTSGISPGTVFQCIIYFLLLVRRHKSGSETHLEECLLVIPSVLLRFQHPDRTIPVIIIGLLVFLPGFYHLRIAYYAAKGYRGYSYDDIPDFGD